jgi:hypothetical protein
MRDLYSVKDMAFDGVEYTGRYGQSLSDFAGRRLQWAETAAALAKERIQLVHVVTTHPNRVVATSFASS